MQHPMLTQTLMSIVERNPSALLTRFIRHSPDAKPIGWLQTETLNNAQGLHRALMFKTSGRYEVLHVQFQLSPTPKMPSQVFEAHTGLARELRHPRRPGPPAITSAVVLLTGPLDVYHTQGALRTSPLNRPFNGVHFEIDPLYQHPTHTLMTRPQPLWRVFTPLARDIDSYGLISAMSDLQGCIRDEDTRRRVYRLMARLTDINPRGTHLRREIEAFARHPRLPTLGQDEPTIRAAGLWPTVSRG